MAPVISFQDRGHGMTTERRTMAFFYARIEHFRPPLAGQFLSWSRQSPHVAPSDEM